MIPENLWEWMFAPVLIFLWTAFDMVAYTFPFWSWLVIVFYVRKIARK